MCVSVHFSNGYLERQTCEDSVSFNSALLRVVMKYDVIHYKVI